MTYSEIITQLKKGKLGKLPNFIGYFKWDYALNDMVFYNGDYSCKASDLNVLDRKDFFYIL